MTSKPEVVYYAPLPTSTPQNYVVLPLYPHRRNTIPRATLLNRYLLTTLSLLIILSLTTFILWPSHPKLQLVRVKLNHIKFRSSPSLFLDLSISLKIRVQNRDLFSLNYDSIDVSIGYRGKELGFVKSQGGKITARKSSYVNATVDVDGFEILHDFIYLIEDVAAGSVQFDTVSIVDGNLRLFFFNFPIQTKVSCEVYINPAKQTINRQNCYPE